MRLVGCIYYISSHVIGKRMCYRWRDISQDDPMPGCAHSRGLSGILDYAYPELRDHLVGVVFDYRLTSLTRESSAYDRVLTFSLSPRGNLGEGLWKEIWRPGNLSTRQLLLSSCMRLFFTADKRIILEPLDRSNPAVIVYRDTIFWRSSGR
jgi:hypothetical protein